MTLFLRVRTFCAMENFFRIFSAAVFTSLLFLRRHKKRHGAIKQHKCEVRILTKNLNSLPNSTTFLPSKKVVQNLFKVEDDVTINGICQIVGQICENLCKICQSLYTILKNIANILLLWHPLFYSKVGQIYLECDDFAL